MGALTEIEIFDCLTDNLRGAADDADILARTHLKGEVYDRFRRRLLLIEGACRQASLWRQDTRWLPMGRLMAEVHGHAGNWLRGVKMPDGTRVKIAAGKMNPLFVMLADNLRNALAGVERLKNRATGRLGMILPEMQAAPHRDTRPVGWGPSIIPSVPAAQRRLILPPSAGIQ